ncbi:unnamed protein product [Bursaphelenchus xylophilus]|uniref:(pine wood nematode) hypothetical protein n=1 Tax=Bursaphelenchus xylophilus TaxID=6326 RepID=A0A811L7T9_BURXY|nr:unnamed protein product [Bursaphelenchus xylophilus]CAG9113134.1 unnamed protein product [Bursaphelenchus xylophilus]
MIWDVYYAWLRKLLHNPFGRPTWACSIKGDRYPTQFKSNGLATNLLVFVIGAISLLTETVLLINAKVDRKLLHKPFVV